MLSHITNTNRKGDDYYWSWRKGKRDAPFVSRSNIIEIDLFDARTSSVFGGSKIV